MSETPTISDAEYIRLRRHSIVVEIADITPSLPPGHEGWLEGESSQWRDEYSIWLHGRLQIEDGTMLALPTDAIYRGIAYSPVRRVWQLLLSHASFPFTEECMVYPRARFIASV